MITNAKIVSVGADAGEYHTPTGERGSKEFTMTSSALREFGRCPARWLAGYKSPESDAKDWGNLLDTLLLTPERFADRYKVRPSTYQTTVMECPSCKSVSDSKSCRACKVDRVAVVLEKDWVGNAKECQAWLAANSNAEIISAETLADAQAAVRRVREDSTMNAVLAESDRQVWVEARWEDEATGVSFPIRALLDLVPRVDSEFHKILGDLKTTRNAALEPWNRFAYSMGYHIQAAFHTDLYVAATGEKRLNWVFLLSENYAPWQTGKRLMGEEYLELGRADYQRLLAVYAKCLKLKEWPGYDDTDEAIQGWSLVRPEPWMQSREMFAPKFAFDDAEAVDDTQPVEDLIP